MEEEMTEKGRGDAESSEGESGLDTSNNLPGPTKRERERPKVTKELQVWVTDVNLELGSDFANGGSTQRLSRRGRPKGSGKKRITQQRGEQGSGTDHPKKRGRPKKYPNKDLPKGSTKRESAMSREEDDGSMRSPRGRGRPKGSLNKKPRLIAEMEAREESSEAESEDDEDANISIRGRKRVPRDLSNGISRPSRRKRGRPARVQKTATEQVTDGSQTPKRGRGRPKGSLNKKPSWKVETVASAAKVKKRGRPRKGLPVRGRPRKYPLPSPEELKKPKVWKPLGRPRKYPRVDPPDGDAPAARRSRGRPRKAESKKGAHLRKSLPATSDGSPRKRGRPPGTGKSGHPPGTVKSGDGTPRKRGRPKLSVKKSALPGKHRRHKRGKVAEQEDYEGEGQVEQEVEQSEEMVPLEDAEHPEETGVDEDGSVAHV